MPREHPVLQLDSEQIVSQRWAIPNRTDAPSEFGMTYAYLALRNSSAADLGTDPLPPQCRNFLRARGLRFVSAHGGRATERARSTCESRVGTMHAERYCGHGGCDCLTYQPVLGERGGRICRWAKSCHADEWRHNVTHDQQHYDYRGQRIGLFDIQQNMRNHAGSFGQLHREHSFLSESLGNANCKFAIQRQRLE